MSDSRNRNDDRNDRAGRSRRSEGNDMPLSRKQRQRRPDRGPLSVGSNRGKQQFHKKPELTIQTTTLWEYPSQHYGDEMQGDKNYAGATPSWVIWQLLQRYTKQNDLVLDPMCGSGTTIDVCADTGRVGVGFDLSPVRDEITQSDARDLPVTDESFDFAFVDPPYSTHIDYSDDPSCIGKLDALNHEDRGAAYYEAMAGVLSEMHRALKPGAMAAVYVSDSFKKRRGAPRENPGTFAAIGFSLWALMMEVFEPVDIIAVVRKNEKLSRGNWRKAAEEQNFYLRGFNYLMIVRKPEDRRQSKERNANSARGSHGDRKGVRSSSSRMGSRDRHQSKSSSRSSRRTR